MLANNPNYLELFERVKQEIVETRNRVATHAVDEVICMYWRIGSHLNEEREYGTGYIDTLSKDIRRELHGVTWANPRNLRYMAKFNREMDEEILHTACAKLSWSHNRTLMDRVKDLDQRRWYAFESLENGWSRAVLEHQIETRLYERQALSGNVSNFSSTLPDPQSELAQQQLKDPYVFDFITARQSYQEHDIEQQMVDNVTRTLLELGTGFAFMGRQYHFMVAGEDFYVDLLFYNVKLHCYVVIELKNAAFKPEYMGKLTFYISAIDGELRSEGDNPTIGLLLCKEKNDVVAEYTLKDINQPIGVSEYRLGDVLPDDFAKYLPSPEDLQARI